MRRPARGSAAPNAGAPLGRLAASAALRRVPLAFIAAGVPAALLLGAFAPAAVPRDVAIAAAILAAVFVAEGVRTRGAGSAITRAAIYAAAIFVAYLLALYPSAISAARLAQVGAMSGLGLAVALYVRYSPRQEFGTTPTDFLVVFGVLALVAFGSISSDSRSIVELVACAAALLYGSEVVIGRGGDAVRVLNVATFAALAVVALRGLA
jgi:UDP-GlcNAc:undecaprenyl-phosphate GlcNAc-1-phosphate transferase